MELNCNLSVLSVTVTFHSRIRPSVLLELEAKFHSISNLYKKIRVIKKNREGSFIFTDDKGDEIGLNNIDTNKLRSIIIEDIKKEIKALKGQLKVFFND